MSNPSDAKSSVHTPKLRLLLVSTPSLLGMNGRLLSLPMSHFTRSTDIIKLDVPVCFFIELSSARATKHGLSSLTRSFRRATYFRYCDKACLVYPSQCAYRSATPARQRHLCAGPRAPRICESRLCSSVLLQARSSSNRPSRTSGVDKMSSYSAKARCPTFTMNGIR
jgi:hypothetical protein